MALSRHTCHPSTEEAEGGGCEVEGHLGLHSETVLEQKQAATRQNRNKRAQGDVNKRATSTHLLSQCYGQKTEDRSRKPVSKQMKKVVLTLPHKTYVTRSWGDDSAVTVFAM